MYISRKRLLIMSITILMMILLSNIFGITNNTKIQYAVTTARVNLRKNTLLDNSSIIKILNKNENLKIINELNNFYIVQLQTNEFGLVSKEYVKLQNISDINKFSEFEILNNTKGTIKYKNTNLRNGPGINFTLVTTLNDFVNLDVLGKINNWYLINYNNHIGFIRNDLIEISNNNSNNNVNLSNTPETILNLINEERKKQNSPELKIDNLLNTTAQKKAKDMVDNNYFSHNSPKYGSPFKMIQNSSITYKTAGENIAGNQSIQKAVESWLSSEIHKKNLLSNAYNYIGIGLKESDTYGYVIVVMFIGK